jgi:molybdate transport system permease protein
MSSRSRAVRTPLPWLAALLVAYLVVPLVAFVARAAGGLDAAGAGGGVDPAGAGAALAVSAQTATVATVVTGLLGVPLGYLLAHARGRLAAVVGVAVQLPLALPPLISGILLVYLVGPYTVLGGLFAGGLTDNRVGIVLAQVFVASPFLIVAARSAFASVDPALSDVAATLGHRRWARFTRVALPGATDGIRAGLLLSWLRAFGEFGATVVLAYHPYSLPVYTYVQFGSAGLPATIIPVAVTLGAAVLVLALAGGTLRRRRSPVPGDLPPVREPGRVPARQLDIDLHARLGGFELRLAYLGTGNLAILGPSGAGKSFALRLIAGLATAEAGHVRLGDRELTGVPAERRRLGYLPQDAALSAHRGVWRQVVFGVGADRGVAAHWLHRLGLAELAERLPGQLSGGQRRRVALAQALAREPELLLLDEPFTGLDTPVRDELRRELRRLQREGRVRTVLVTHDPDEAALLADQVLLIRDGRPLQAGPQPEVFAHPATPEAARLLGIRNVRHGHLLAGRRIATGSLRLPVAGPARAGAGPVSWCIRPAAIRLVDHGGYPAVVLDVVHLGASAELVLDLDGCELTAEVPTGETPAPGAHVRVHLPPEAVTMWPTEPRPVADPAQLAG